MIHTVNCDPIIGKMRNPGFGAPVVFPGPRDLLPQQRAHALPRVGGGQIGGLDAVPPHFVRRQVDARARQVLADVPDDVGQLHRDAEVDGPERGRPDRAACEDLGHHQAHDGKRRDSNNRGVAANR